MPRYQIVTLVDITRTDPSRSETDRILLGQQANFNSLLQAIGLRSNVEWSTDPVKKDGRLPPPFKGSAVYWLWQFDCEREQVFEKGTDPVSLLKDDLHGVPVIDRLHETIDLTPPAFQTQGEMINIWVTQI